MPEMMNPQQAAPATPDRRGLIASGIAWNSAFQLFLVAINFISMLVLVRLLPPREYGRATAATGLLALINCFNCGAFIAQALQLPEGRHPDWDAHWRAGMWIQFALFLVCNIVAGATWLFPAYRAIAPLLHVASIGLLIDVPSQLAGIKLRRAMDFRALRLTNAVAVLLTLVSSIALAISGAGAYALIVGSNVLHGLPFGFYLLFVERWRPRKNWWSWPDFGGYQSALHFGAQQSGSAVVAALRGMLESLIIPASLGYEALGLLNRAQVLFSTTVGRASGLVIETVYPLLPRSATDPQQFARHATLFVQSMLLISVPGAAFVGMEGPYLSRLLYGQKWIAADPLIWPGTIFALGVAITLVCTTVLQAKNRLRMAFTANVLAACLCLPAMFVAIGSHQARLYIWVLAIGQMIAAGVTLLWACKLLQGDWLQRVLIPPIVIALIGIGALSLLNALSLIQRPLAAVIIDATVFAVACVGTARFLFGPILRELLIRLPGAKTLLRVAYL